MTAQPPLAQSVPAFAEALRRHEAGDLAGARMMYLDLVDQPSLTAPCLQQLALIAANKGEHGRAAELFRRAIRLDAGQWLAHANLSAALDRLGDPVGAVAALVDFGATLQTLGRHDEAERIYAQVLARDPLSYGAHVNLGTCLAWQGRLSEAAGHLARGIGLYGRLVPEIAAFLRDLLRRLEGRIDFGVSALPDGLPTGRIEKIEDALTTLGKVLSESCYPHEAVLCHLRAVEQAPGFALGHWNLALALLAIGSFPAGWREYEWRWRWDKFPELPRRLPAPVWRGEALAGKRILVWAEQGYGDAIQFAPLALRLAAQLAEVVLEVPTPLTRLFGASLTGVTVIDRPDHPDAVTTDLPMDFVVPLMSLPERLGLNAGDRPLAASYLHPVPADAAAWAERLPTGDRPRVGIVWAGRTTHTDDARRSLPFALVRQLLTVDDVTWHSLQVGSRQQDLAGATGVAITDMAPRLGDFADTAAAIANLDLVIAVDTAVAHLAASMGRPVWLLLPRAADWRWGADEAETPWYPSLRIFRQSRAGAWDDVVAAVRAALVDLGQRKGG